MEIYMDLPLTAEKIKSLKAGDFVYLSGELYTARDAAHKRLYEAALAGKDLPIDLENETVYYLGPTPTRPGRVTGSAGPTTSGRMDKYTPLLLSLGLKGMIGKGKRSSEVSEAIKENGAVYLVTVGGVGALLSQCIVKSEVLCYEDLGTEAIRRITVKDFPCIVWEK